METTHPGRRSSPPLVKKSETFFSLHRTSSVHCVHVFPFSFFHVWRVLSIRCHPVCLFPLVSSTPQRAPVYVHPKQDRTFYTFTILPCSSSFLPPPCTRPLSSSVSSFVILCHSFLDRIKGVRDFLSFFSCLSVQDHVECLKSDR